MSIRGDIEELKNIELEIKRLNTQLTKWRKKRTEVKNRIDEYLVSKDQPGTKYGDIAIYRNEKEKHSKKGIKKKDIDEQILSLFKNNGINNAKDMYEELNNIIKGPKVITSDIKMKKIQT